MRSHWITRTASTVAHAALCGPAPIRRSGQLSQRNQAVATPTELAHKTLLSAGHLGMLTRVCLMVVAQQVQQAMYEQDPDLITQGVATLGRLPLRGIDRYHEVAQEHLII
mmetsp:Transcript_73680/g.163758  ORF Transcript_73680/g.163758 Transcript_73680/m.163758 type:complete len:110 (+) Transcript_73680:145-474(+)